MRPAALSIALALALGPACGPAANPPGPLLVRDGDRGVEFRHVTGGRGKRELPESMGGGLALLDHDRDGDLDLYLSQSGPLPRPNGKRKKGVRNALYSNDGEARFELVRGAAADPSYGQAVAVGDADGDGWDDLLSLNWGPNRLYRNDGGGFVDATERAGVAGDEDWSIGAAFFDAEGDGDLDLYVVNYLVCEPGSYLRLDEPEGFSSYPHPDRYLGAQDRFYENVGDGRFVERTFEAGFEQALGKGLGVAPTDVDLDGLTDLYVANDSTPNYLYHNRGGLRFEEVGQELGCAYNEDGRSEAGMGVDSGDVDEDGDFDLFVTNLDQETNTLYRNGLFRRVGDGVVHGSLGFRDVARGSGMASASRPLVGFGALLSDIDGDGHLDALVANGHIIDNIVEFTDMESYPQPNHLFLGDGRGRFRLAGPELAGEGLGELTVSRGLATGDLDGDGDLDYVFGSVGGGVQLFFGEPRTRDWFALRLVGPPGNPHGLGAAVRLVAVSGVTRLRRIESARSYASASEPVLFTGLPEPLACVEVLWPGGAAERFTLAPNELRGRVTLRHGAGTPMEFAIRR